MSTSTNHSQNSRGDYPELNDDELLSLIASHQDRLALAELYDRHKLSVGRFLQRKIYDSKLIDEVYNDVMLIVWNKAAHFRGESKVLTWIFGIAYRTQLTHTRKENRHKHSDIDELVLSVEPDHEIYTNSQTSEVEALTAALVGLSEQHKTVIDLAYFHGYSILEMSNIIGCPKNTVKTRLFHARKKLKVILEAQKTLGNSRSSTNSSTGKNDNSRQRQTKSFLGTGVFS